MGGSSGARLFRPVLVPIALRLFSTHSVFHALVCPTLSPLLQLLLLAGVKAVASPSALMPTSALFAVVQLAASFCPLLPVLPVRLVHLSLLPTTVNVLLVTFGSGLPIPVSSAVRPLCPTHYLTEEATSPAPVRQAMCGM